MATNRTRKPRRPLPDISETTLQELSDGFFVAEHFDKHEKFFTDYDIIWQSVRDQIIELWVSECPGRRPSYWWNYNAPPASAAWIVENRWDKFDFAANLREPRERVGGIGLALWEQYRASVPDFAYGIPSRWFSIDQNNPPVYESQASYLKRHGLLLPGEERRLTRKDFEVETVEFENPRTESEEETEKS